MFLSKLFKRTKNKVMVAIAGLTMVLGAGATISTVAATQQNEVVETKAGDPGAQEYTHAKDDSNSTLVLRVLASNNAQNYSANNARTKIQIKDGGSNWSDPWWSFASSWMDKANNGSNYNWNAIKLNGADWYYYQEVKIGDRRNWLNSNSNYVYIGRYTNDGENWQADSYVQSGGSSIPSKWLAGGTSNSIYLASAGSGSSTSFSPQDKGLIFKIRRMSKATTGGSYTRDGCEVYDTAHAYKLPAPTNTPSGHEFAGWYSDSTCTKYIGAVDDTYTPSSDTGDITLYAKYVSKGSGFVLTGNSTFLNTAKGSSYKGYAWTLAGGIAKSTTDIPDYSGYWSGISLAAGALFQARNGDTWYHPSSVEVYPSGAVTISGDNLSVATAGSYDIYVNTTNNKYLIARTSDLRHFSITFQIVCDGVLQDALGAYTGTVDFGGTYADIYNCYYDTDVACTGPSNRPDIPGYTLSGWYSSTTMNSSTSISSTKVTGSVTATGSVYARYVSANARSIFYECGDYKANLIGSKGYAFFLDGSKNILGDIKWPGISTYTVAGFANLFWFTLPGDAAYFILNSNQSGKANQSIDIASDATHNLYLFNDAEGTGEKKGEWADVAFYLETTSSSDTSFSSPTRTIMSIPSAAKGQKNNAELTNFSVTSGNIGRISVYKIDGSGLTNWSDYYTLGSGDEGKTAACANQGTTYFTFKVSAPINFYLTRSDSKVFMVNNSSIASCGNLIIGSTHSASDVTVVTTTAAGGEGTKLIDGDPLSTAVDGLVASVGLTFNSKTHLYSIPIYNLRGTKSSQALYARFTVGGLTLEVDLPTATDTNLNLYLDLATSDNDFSAFTKKTSNAYVAKGTAALAAIDISDAIAKAPNSSVCNIDETPAHNLYLEYTAGITALTSQSIATSLLSNATILTYSNASAYDSDGHGYQDMIDDGTTGNVNLSDIANQLGVKGGDVSSVHSIYGPKGNESPLTLTLWIVLGAGILGLGAIGTAYFVSKKKKRHQA